MKLSIYKHEWYDGGMNESPSPYTMPFMSPSSPRPSRGKLLGIIFGAVAALAIITTATLLLVSYLASRQEEKPTTTVSFDAISAFMSTGLPEGTQLTGNEVVSDGSLVLLREVRDDMLVQSSPDAVTVAIGALLTGQNESTLTDAFVERFRYGSFREITPEGSLVRFFQTDTISCALATTRDGEVSALTVGCVASDAFSQQIAQLDAYPRPFTLPFKGVLIYTLNEQSSVEGARISRLVFRSGDNTKEYVALYVARSADAAWELIGHGSSYADISCDTYATEELKQIFRGYPCGGTQSGTYVEVSQPTFEVLGDDAFGG